LAGARRSRAVEVRVFDYHVHTEFSVDCKIPMAQQCEAAIAMGITEIAFTDHIDHEPADPGFGYYRAEAYFASLEDVRQRYGDRLTILAGAEVDFNERIVGDVERFLGQHEFDFVIGSVHYGEAGQIIFQDYFEGRSWDDVYLPYLRRVKLAVETGWFDTIGHLDLPKRYAPKTHRIYDPVLFKEALTDVFQAMIANGVAFEINTSGLRQAPKTSMPGPAIVRWYAEAGGRLITTGTDSHAPQHVGTGIAKTLDMLTMCGIEQVASFRGRRMTLRAIDELRAVRA
jgi:histidinol-phosphatase (PHP family)